MKSKSNISIIGCGYWGPNLIRNFHTNPNCTVKSVCDLDKERLAHIMLLQDVDNIILPEVAPDNKHVFHLYAVRVLARDALLQSLAAQDIHCGIHYPVALHLQKAYRFLKQHEDSFPVAERCAEQFISLPMYPELREEQIAYVAHAVKNFLSEHRYSYAKAS
ncbi:MAG: DegT/DnrJ/EryC1/StrS family aminotransferase [bacterium]